MPETSPEYIINILPWLLPLLVVLLIWGWMNWKALNNPNDKAFERVVGWLREDSFGQLYLRFLGGVMDRVGDWIGDRPCLSQAAMAEPRSKGLVQRVFGFNPFTAESYEKCLWLAFMYPVFAYFIAWALGAEGQVGNTNLFGSKNNELMLWQRWLAIVGMFLLVSANLWFILLWHGWVQWLALIGVLVISAVAKSWLDIGNNTAVELLVIFFIIFSSFFTSLYLSGLLVGLVVYRSFQKAHLDIYILSIVVSASFTSAFFIANGNNDTGISVISGAGIGALPFAVAIIVSAIGARTNVVVVTVAVSIAISFSDTLVEKLAITVIAAGASIITLKALHQLSKKNKKLHWFWLIYSVFLVGFGLIHINANSTTYMLFILIWLVLPLANAPIDWLSLGFTRGLLQAVRSGNHSGYRTLIWAAADLMLAFFFLFLITAVLVGVTALGNAVAGKTLVDIGCILSNLKADMSHPDHWWIYFMLLSTLVPTLFHFALAGGAASLWLPRKWRLQLADGLEEDMHKTFGAWVYLTFTPVVGFILMPLALLGSLWWLLNANGSMFGAWLLGWAIQLAEWADPSLTLVCAGG